ncbi:MAG: hypothetical protein PHV32_11105 [Eubacteriales bacterium]|nr:hypothetical protein [Eubacteriales bacterium]
MMNQYSFNNPFVECTARDMEYNEVSKYWCSPFYLYNINEKMLFHSQTPILLEGARGCGKTMILKYLSFFYQVENIEHNKENIINHFNNLGSIGIYFRFKNDFGKVLETINCLKENKDILFEHYFYMYYTRELLLIFIELKKFLVISEEEELMLSDVKQKYDIAQSESFKDLLDYVNLNISNADSIIKRMRHSSKIQDEISNFQNSKILFESLLVAFRQRIEHFKNIKFLILLDEYENIKDFHIIINTLLRQVDSSEKISYRIGMRPESISSYKTSISDELIQPNRDYILISLRINNAKKYQRFLKEISKKRLNTNDFFKENKLINIDELFGLREDWEHEASLIAKSDLDKSFSLLDEKLLQKQNIEEVKKLLRNHERPLLQLMNVIWFNRGKSAEEISHAMNMFLTLPKKDLKQKDDCAYKYMLDYSMKYKYQLVFVLISLYPGASKKYYSFTTFSYLASGSVNDFITLCRNTFSQLDELCFVELIKNKTIPIEYQNNGAQEAAKEQLDKFRICEDNGKEMYTFVMNMSEVFRTFHRDPAMQYPETNQFAFVDEADLSRRDLLYTNFKNMLKWGVVERKNSLQRLSISVNKKGDIYYINRLIAPIFEISYRTRGGYNFIIKTSTFEKMLTNSMDAKQIINENKKDDHPQKVIKPKENNNYQQLTLLEDFGHE